MTTFKTNDGVSLHYTDEGEGRPLVLIHGWPLATFLERAQAFAARIVGQRGATRADRALYAPLIADWKR